MKRGCGDMRYEILDRCPEAVHKKCEEKQINEMGIAKRYFL
jgi:hypothetical protein